MGAQTYFCYILCDHSLKEELVDTTFDPWQFLLGQYLKLGQLLYMLGQTFTCCESDYMLGQTFTCCESKSLVLFVQNIKI
jgi:hypothetical protein